MTRVIRTRDDLTVADRDTIADLAADGWDQTEFGESVRFDWDDFLNRAEKYLDAELPDQMDDPVILTVQRIARQASREARG
jgi:hypothetical protein